MEPSPNNQPRDNEQSILTKHTHQHASKCIVFFFLVTTMLPNVAFYCYEAIAASQHWCAQSTQPYANMYSCSMQPPPPKPTNPGFSMSIEIHVGIPLPILNKSHLLVVGGVVGASQTNHARKMVFKLIMNNTHHHVNEL